MNPHCTRLEASPQEPELAAQPRALGHSAGGRTSKSHRSWENGGVEQGGCHPHGSHGDGGE